MRRSFGSRIRVSPERPKSCDRAIEKQCQPAGVKPKAPILPDPCTARGSGSIERTPSIVTHS